MAMATAVVIACGSETETGQNNNAGSSGSSGSSQFGSGDGGNGNGNGGDGGNGTGTDCNAPVDMFIMFDRSTSMQADCNIGANTNSKWCRGITALSGYFKSQGAQNQAAALQFFPHSDHQQSSCGTGNGYDTAAAPATGYTTLPTSDFDTTLNSQAPQGGAGNNPETPTEAAIRGLTRFTAANRRGGRVTIGILITDGEPRGDCNNGITFLANLLKAHNDATKVRTYVIGMEGADFDNLERIAIGGGGPEHPSNVGAATGTCGAKQTCHHWNVGDGNPTVFAAALAAIQESADGCKEGGGYINPVN
jgi:hypothetical protein